MGFTQTTNHSLYIPDKDELMPNWSAQNVTDTNTIDAICTTTKSTYSPTWIATGTNPTVGNSTIYAPYIIPVPGFVLFWISIEIGSTFVDGSGSYQFSLPFTAHPTYPTTGMNSAGIPIGKAFFYDANSQTNSQTGVPMIWTSTSFRIMGEQGTSAFGSGLGVVSTDRIKIMGMYALA